jgi:hypothetical protein
MYVPKSEFGWTRNAGWLHGDEASYNNAVAALKKHAKPGRKRINDIHPSWADYVVHFDPTDTTRSQGAFCRWANLNPASFSSWKIKPLKDDLERFILEWVSIFQDNE